MQRPNAAADFWAKVLILGPDDCWPFTGSRQRRGYGQFKYQGRNWRANRLALYLTAGKLDEDALHTCDNPPCCNPSHLYDGDHAANTRDRVDRGRTKVRAEHGMARLSEDDVAEIRSLQGWTQQAIAERYGVTQSYVSKILRNARWKESV
jgi:hypothetical protein